MNKFIQKIALSLLGLSIATMQLANAQSVEYGPGRDATSNYTIVGFFTPAPPVIDAIIDDFCWLKAAAPANAVSGGAGYTVTSGNFPQQIKEQINVADGGTLAPNTPPINPYTAGYPASAGSFGMCWDLNYVYFAIKIVNQAAADLTAATNDRGVELFFNNGNGRSGVTDPVNENYPRKYNNLRDMQVQLWYLPKPGDTDFPLLGALDGLANYGISLPPSGYKFAVKKTSDGYIYEGKIAWTVLNKEFINEADGSYVGDPISTVTGKTVPTSKWRPLKGRLLGVDIGASLFRGSGPQEQMNWNECCFNVNWTRSAYYGYFQLAGDTVSAVCPVSYNITLTSNNISVPNKKETVGANLFLPEEATRELTWTLSGSTPDGHPYALIDNNTGTITPLNNGVLTITGKPKLARCAATSTVPGVIFLTIGAQVVPTDIVITGTDITTNWGTSALVASAVPSNAPSDVIWSIDPASPLATINSVTGVLKATALGSGPVTVKATSIANGIVGSKVVNITTPVIISTCIGINSYSYIYQCNRTLNAMTIAGFKIGQKVTLLTQYFDAASVGTIPGIPATLMNYTIQQTVPAATVSRSADWELTLNQPTGFFSITGVYLNDTTKKIQVKVKLLGTTTLTGCDATTSGVGYFSVNNVDVCGTLGIDDDLIEASSFELFPNPTDGDVNVGVTLQAGGVLSVSIVNMLGEVVVSSSGAKHSGYSLTKLSTASLSPGLYVVKASVSGGGVVAKKLLVTK